MTTRREIFKLGAVGALGLAGFKGGDDDIPTTGPSTPLLTASQLAPRTSRFPTRGSSAARPSSCPTRRASTAATRPGRSPGTPSPRSWAGPARARAVDHAWPATTASFQGRPSGPARAPGSRCGSATPSRPPGCAARSALNSHPPARVGVAAAVRRLRQRHHHPRPSEELLLPELPGGPHALVPRPRRHHITAQNVYSGLAGFYPLSDEFERAQLPQGEYDVPLMISDAHVQRDGSPGLRRQRASKGSVGRRHPGQRRALAHHGGQAADLPVPGARSRRSHAPTGPRCSTGDPVYVVGTDAGMTPKVRPATSGGTARPSATRCSSTSAIPGPGRLIELRNL